MSENPAEYQKTLPMLRPLNAEENSRHEITTRQNQRLEKDLTMAHIQLGDRHAELRMMRVAVEVLTGRALKAEARVKEQQAELAEQEVAKLSLLNELKAFDARYPVCATCEKDVLNCECLAAK